MPNFRYRAVTQAGELVAGTIAAPNIAEVERRIEYLRLVPIEDISEEPAAARGSSIFGQRVRGEDVTSFTQDLALLLKAGVRLEQGLELLARDADIGRLKNTVEKVRQDVLAGESFSDALRKHPSAFPATYLSLVRVGESSGTLERILELLARDRQREELLRRKIGDALRYPAFLFFASIFVLVFFLTFVLPQFAGVLKDFNWSSPEYQIVGLFISVMGSEDSAALWTGKGGCLYTKLSADAHISAVIDQVKSEYNKYAAASPFEYYFLDDAFDSLYKAESRLANILTVFTTLSIIIACLGLLGLVTFIAVQKTKEIGVRKVLGASIVSIWNLLSKEYLVLIAVAFLIAAPVAWLLMKTWLQNFAYRTSLDWWIFLATILSTITVALLTVSYQAIKAAIANPIKSLRNE